MTINDRRVAHRNLHIIDGPAGPAPGSGGPGAGSSPAPGIPFSGLTTLFVPNRWNPANTHRVLPSRSGMESTGRLAFLLPAGVAGQTPGLPPKCGVPSNTPGAVTITLPKGLVADGFALGANGTIQLAERASVVDARGTLAPVANANTGEVRVGVSAQVGSIFGRGNVVLADRSTVGGNVTYQGQLFGGNDVTITGTTQQTTSLSPTDSVSFVVTYPPTSRSDRTVNSGQFLSEAPGRLGVIQVNSGGRLRLSSGTYYLEALRIEAQAVLELNQTAGPTIIHTRQQHERNLFSPRHDGSAGAAVRLDLHERRARRGRIRSPCDRRPDRARAGALTVNCWPRLLGPTGPAGSVPHLHVHAVSRKKRTACAAFRALSPHSSGIPPGPLLVLCEDGCHTLGALDAPGHPLGDTGYSWC